MSLERLLWVSGCHWLITDYMNVKWDGTISLRVTQWVHFVLGVWIVTGT